MDEAFELIDLIVKNDIAYGFPSVQIAVIKDGKYIYENAWGENITNDTLFDLASNTKMYSVVYAVQWLVTNSRLDINTKIVDILGDRFANDVLDLKYDSEDAEYSDIQTQKKWKRSLTVKDVLAHRAGHPAEGKVFYLDDYGFVGCDKNPLFVGNDASENTRTKVLDALCKLPLCYEPRTRILYSDVDFVLMGLIVEKITGKGLQEFLSETFWKPLGITNITYDPLKNGFDKSDCAPTELYGNTRDGSVWFDGIRTGMIQGEAHDETAWYAMAGVSGHAGLFANAHDLARLANVMIENNGYFSDEVIDRFTSALSNDHDEWGIGWYRQGDKKRTGLFSTLSGENTVGHQGWTGTLTLIDREQKLVIVILTSKRNTPVTDPSVDKNAFDGNNYITSKLCFAEIIYSAIKNIPFEGVIDMFVSKMQAQYKESPSPAAKKALESILKTQKEWKNR